MVFLVQWQEGSSENHVKAFMIGRFADPKDSDGLEKYQILSVLILFESFVVQPLLADSQITDDLIPFLMTLMGVLSQPLVGGESGPK